MLVLLDSYGIIELNIVINILKGTVVGAVLACDLARGFEAVGQPDPVFFAKCSGQPLAAEGSIALIDEGCPLCEMQQGSIANGRSPREPGSGSAMRAALALTAMSELGHSRRFRFVRFPWHCGHEFLRQGRDGPIGDSDHGWRLSQRGS